MRQNFNPLRNNLYVENLPEQLNRLGGSKEKKIEFSPISSVSNKSKIIKHFWDKFQQLTTKIK